MTKSIKHRVILGLAAITCGLAALTTVGSASAAENAATTPMAGGAAAPACVTYTHSQGPLTGTFRIHNGCADPVRVKLILKVGPNSSCTQLKPGEGFDFRTPIGKFDGIENC